MPTTNVQPKGLAQQLTRHPAVRSIDSAVCSLEKKTSKVAVRAKDRKSRFKLLANRITSSVAKRSERVPAVLLFPTVRSVQLASNC